MFQTKGIITYDPETYTEDEILEAALELGAEDISASDDVIEVYTDPGEFSNVLEGLQEKGFSETSAEVEKIADTTISLDDEKTRKVLRIIERLEELDDVQQVSSNLEIPDDFNDEEE
jgi:transcriptional/translational regulatory protein YebC/TACO1